MNSGKIKKGVKEQIYCYKLNSKQILFKSRYLLKKNKNNISNISPSLGSIICKIEKSNSKFYKILLRWNHVMHVLVPGQSKQLL